MTEKRLLIAAEIFPPAVGGPATYAATLARELPLRGWRLTVMLYGDANAGEYPATMVTVARRGGPIGRYWRYLRTLWRQSMDFPLIYAQGPVSSGLPALIVAKLRRKKLVVKVTGDYAWEQAFRAGATAVFIDAFQRQPVGGKYGWLRRIQQYVCRRADAVVTPSAFLQGLVAGWGVPPGRIHVIPNAIPAPRVSEERQALRRQFGIPLDAFVVVTAGRPVPWKGYGELTHAVIRWLRVQRDASVRLVVVGVTVAQLEAFAEAAGADEIAQYRDHITAVGPLPTIDVWRWLRAADIFVLNSAYEGLSHMTVEAMHLGLPVVVSRVGGNPELVQTGVNGVLIRYGDSEELLRAMLNLYHHPELRARLGAAAELCARGFSVQHMVDQTAGLLADVCAS